jgi:hypothetical protein
MRRHLLIVLALAGIAAAGAAPADAFYGYGAQMVSASFDRLEQGDDASNFAAVSADGRYVVFETRARNLFADDDPDPPGAFRAGGIFRFDLVTRDLVLVADGDLFDEESGELLALGARSPSVSAGGRFVSFSTAQQLVPQDQNGNVDVYVRDMLTPIDDPGSFELISAQDGTDLPALYADQPGVPDGLKPGSDMTAGAAISGSGNEVAFRTIAPSSLPARPGPDTPAFQLWVRNRATNTTTLVTRTMQGGNPAGGALGPARLSADGSTVVWTGQNAPEQTRFIPGENTSSDLKYYLWRRVADGPEAPTRRITGASDPDDPACAPTGEVNFDQTSTGPCFGPLTGHEGNLADILQLLPAMSGDGRKVAFLTGSNPRPNISSGGPALDLFLTDMSPGLTRKQATEELTREGTSGDPATGGPVESVSMSQDGRWLAVVSSRTTFILPSFRFIGARRANPGPRELYVFDLAERTIERATRSWFGGDIDASISNNPTISRDGGRVAFAALAGNLFPGDANQRSDAFAITREPEPPPEPPPPPDEDPGGSGDSEQTFSDDGGGGGGPRLLASARSLGRGAVELIVRTPSPGVVVATARARLPGARRARRVARARGRARRAERVRLVLRLSRRNRRVLRRRGRLAARVAIRFQPTRGRRRARTIRVTFTQSPPQGRGKR